MMNEYDWIKPGQSYRKKPEYTGHRTRMSVVVIDVSETLGTLEFEYLTGRGSGGWMSLQTFTIMYEREDIK